MQWTRTATAQLAVTEHRLATARRISQATAHRTVRQTSQATAHQTAAAERKISCCNMAGEPAVNVPMEPMK